MILQWLCTLRSRESQPGHYSEKASIDLEKVQREEMIQSSTTEDLPVVGDKNGA